MGQDKTDSADCNMSKIQKKYLTHILCMSIFSLTVSSRLPRNNRNLVNVLLPYPNLPFYIRKELIESIEADDNKGQSLYFKNKSCGKGKLNCKGFGAYCVELLYGASKVQLDSWCFCGSKNYGKTCNNSIESGMQKRKKLVEQEEYSK